MGKFINIVMTSMLGLVLVLGMIFMYILTKHSEIFSQFNGFPFTSISVAFSYMFAIGIYIYPIITLFKFSGFIKKASIDRDSVKLTEALKNLKGFTQYLGILTIIVIAGYLVMLLILALLAANVGFDFLNSLKY